MDFVRDDVRFSSGNLGCAGWFYRPHTERPVPCVVMAQGFGGTRAMRLDDYARGFAKLGYAVLAFDYRHFGDSPGEPRQLIDLEKQRADYRAALAYVRTRTEVDGARLVLWGTSLSGGHVIDVATREAGIAAVISQVPHVSGLATALATPPAMHVSLGLAYARDRVRSWLGREPHYVPLVGEPGTLAAMTSPGAQKALQALRPPGLDVREDVAARVFLPMVRYSPGRRAARVRCPWLVVVADHDTLTPAAPALRAARRAPRAEVVRVPCDHFALYGGERFEHVLGHMQRFVQRHVAASPSRTAGERNGPVERNSSGDFQG